MNQDTTGPITESLQRMTELAENPAPVLERLGQQVILPVFYRHYMQSGLRQRSRRLMTAVAQRGAPGNYFRVTNTSLEVGVVYEEFPYFKWALEGRGPVRAKPGKMLRFFNDYGKPIFRKQVGPAPARPVIFLTPGEITECEGWISDQFGLALTLQVRQT